MDDTVSTPHSGGHRGSWYVLHTQTGHEDKVRQNLLARVRSLGAQEKVLEAVVPSREQVEIRRGQKAVVRRKLFPGYLLVRCLLDDESWAVLRNTPGVTGFAGPGSRPAALRRREVEQFLGPATAGPGSDKDEPVVVLGYGVGETVQVTRGPFTGLDGLVTELSEDKLTLTVLLDVFGRETPVVLDAADVTGSNVV